MLSPFIIIALILGLLIGSFLNVVIYRLPVSLHIGWRKDCEDYIREDDDDPNSPNKVKREESFNIAFPRSHCPSCKAMIPGWCNIPVISYIILKGKCLKCSTKISLRYPAIELLTAVLTAFLIYHFGLTIEAGLLILFTWTLVALSFIDIDHQILPDNMTLPLLWAGLLINANGIFTDLSSAVIGAALGYMILWTVYWAFKLLTGKDGMGFGDFKLLAALGAWMGWQQLPTIIIISSVVGVIIGLASIAFAGKERGSKIPFGPYLAIAGWISFIWGEQLQALYLSALAP